MSFYEENIEAYLSGELNLTDKMAMEEGMLKDPNLKSEVDLQRDIIESLKNTRRIQLKSRLSNIDVAAGVGSGVSNTVKVAASVITVGIVGAGIYYYSLFSSEKAVVEKEQTIEQIDVTPSISNKNSNQSASNASVIVTETEAKANKNLNGSETNLNTKKNNKRNQDGVVEELNVSAFVPNGDFENNETNVLKGKSVDLPDGGIVETVDRKTMNLDIQVEDGNKKDLSYKYFSNKLFLYGDFKDQLYDLVEINTSTAKQLYLGYKGKFYELKSNQTTVARLIEVKDASLLEQLSNKNK